MILGGVTTAIKVAHFRLTYSRMSFVRAYPRETQEMVFAAHQEAFLALGGVPERGIYDNPMTIVDVVLNRPIKGKERTFNHRFLALMNHYRPKRSTRHASRRSHVDSRWKIVSSQPGNPDHQCQLFALALVDQPGASHAGWSLGKNGRNSSRSDRRICSPRVFTRLGRF